MTSAQELGQLYYTLFLKTDGFDSSFNQYEEKMKNAGRGASEAAQKYAAFRNELLKVQLAEKQGSITKQEAVTRTRDLSNRVADLTRQLNLSASAENKFIALAKNAASAANTWEKEVNQTTGAIQKLNNSSRGFKSPFSALGETRGAAQGVGVLTKAFQALWLYVGGQAAINAGRQYFNFLNDAALGSTRAGAALKIYNREVELSGQNSESAQLLIQSLADKYKVSEDVVAGAATTFLRNKFTLEQTNNVLDRAAASALFYGRSAQEGFGQVAEAFQGQSSQALAYIGIAGNISTENIHR
jgi:hypothetical protein